LKEANFEGDLCLDRDMILKWILEIGREILVHGGVGCEHLPFPSTETMVNI
jgi:hypothetical protein